MTADSAMLAAYVETVPGLEEVAWLEVRRRFPRAQFSQFLYARDECGIVAFAVPAEARELFTLRTAESIFLTASLMPKTTRGYRDLHQLREQMERSGDVGRAVNAMSRYRRRQVGSYRLLVRTYGKHEYDRQDVRRAVIQSLDQLYPGWERVQQDPDVECWANVLGSSILLGLRLPPPRDRAHPDTSPGAIPSSVAAALALLAEPQESDRFLDPFYDGGAIIAARAQYPAGLLLGGAPTVGELRSTASTIAAANAHRVCWNADHLPLPAAALNKVATRFPPLGPSVTGADYATWLQEMQRVLQSGAQAVVLTRDFESFKDAVRHARALAIRSGYSVTISGEWGRIYILHRD